MALKRNPDIILLDIMLPRVNGYEICRDVRAAWTGDADPDADREGQEEDIILGLNLGADDYIASRFTEAS